MNQDNDGTGVVIGIIVIIVIGWLFFSSLGNSSSSDTSGDSYESSTSEYEYSGDNEDYYESNGYECTDDCSGHDAGYEWAEENDVCDEYFEDSYSESFDEGVRVYSEDNC